MANVNAKNFGIISAGNTNENKLVLTGKYPVDPDGLVRCLIEVISSASGIQFSNNENIDVNQNPFLTDAKFYATFDPDDGLFFKQSAGADEFSISI